MSTDSPTAITAPRPAGHPVTASGIAAAMSVAFFGFSAAWCFGPFPAYSEPVRRYFLGHPVAIVSTLLFFVALGILAAKAFEVSRRRGQLRRLRDEDIVPDPGHAGHAGHDNHPRHMDSRQAFLQEHSAATVAGNWMTMLGRLPEPVQKSLLVHRIKEVLIRQSDRGEHSRADEDLRELADRDADAAHDSLGLVRIIVWAIPMMGFLGTVIGITQTLGGLDFSSGASAVDSLKSGLNIAFDTTALGLVLAVLAIFLQFPIERSEAGLLAEVDARAIRLIQSNLPSGQAGDEMTSMIGMLCDGIQAAVASSLEDQTRLWRETIEEAQGQWDRERSSLGDAVAKAFEVSLIPGLRQHGETLHAAQASMLQSAAQDRDSRQQLCDAIGSLDQHLDRQSAAIAATSALADVQAAINDNLRHIDTTRHAIREVVQDSLTDNVADALQILGRAVDRLNQRLDRMHDTPVQTIDPTATPPVAAPPLADDSTTHRRAA